MYIVKRNLKYLNSGNCWEEGTAQRFTSEREAIHAAITANVSGEFIIMNEALETVVVVSNLTFNVSQHEESILVP